MIMDTDDKEMLEQIVCDALEDLAFLLAEPVGKDDLPGWPVPAYRVAVEVKGAAEGEILMVVGRGSVQEMAGNMMGVDGAEMEGREAYVEDAAKEMLNTICGHLLPAIVGKEKELERTVPALDQAGAEAWERMLAYPDIMCFDVEGSPLLVVVDIGD